jgi:hypothetical protein
MWLGNIGLVGMCVGNKLPKLVEETGLSYRSRSIGTSRMLACKCIVLLWYRNQHSWSF